MQPDCAPRPYKAHCSTHDALRLHDRCRRCALHTYNNDTGCVITWHMALHTVTNITLAGETDWPGFRNEARALLARLVPPANVTWHTPASGAGDLFSESDAPTTSNAAHAHGPVNLVVPASFVTLCETVILHNDPARFGLLYSLLWRLVHEPALRHDPLDADRVKAQHMAQSVRRDMHKMKAFVRFRTIERDQGRPPLHVAWFEPDHHIVEAVAPFFMRRFTQMEWAILTPERSVHWDGERLHFGPGGEPRDAPAPDAGEALWLTYYANIFNPARLKIAMMKKEMPVKYWHNLPEAELISGLAADAMARSGRMVEAAPTQPARRIMPVVPVVPVAPAGRAERALKTATDLCNL